MKDWEKTLLSPTAEVRDAMRRLEETAAQICLVADDDRRLLGTVTDGDIRRGILRSLPLDAPITEVINYNPHVAPIDGDPALLVAIMRRDQLRAVPLVDHAYRAVGLEILGHILKIETAENWVVLMAGGEGRRLLPLTKDVPKPLLKVGDRPILETILDRFIECGFQRFFISVNYLAEQVEAYFGDGSERGVQISYLREDRKLGTAGALHLLPERPQQPFFVMNGDILTNIDFAQVLEFHLQHRAAATMCVREHLTQVPYGVVDVESYRLLGIVEKPVTRHFVNAGIYVLDPEALDVIPPDGQSHDMPQVFQSLLDRKSLCSAFPLREYWADIGHIREFRRANDEFLSVFGSGD